MSTALGAGAPVGAMSTAIIAGWVRSALARLSAPANPPFGIDWGSVVEAAPHGRDSV